MEPSHEEFESLAREFNLHPLAVEDAINAHQRPKIEVFDDVVLLVLKTARYVDPTEIIELGEILVFLGEDASFIGLSKVLAAALGFARPGAMLVALVKPQFEAGREEVGKGGVVRDEAVHRRVCDDAAAWVASQGWRVVGLTESPITGPEGNREFLLGAIKE